MVKNYSFFEWPLPSPPSKIRFDDDAVPDFCNITTETQGKILEEVFKVVIITMIIISVQKFFGSKSVHN